MKLPVLFFAPMLLMGQVIAPIKPLPDPIFPIFNELKIFLSLTDSQVEALQAVANSRSEATNAIYTQINEKYATLKGLLENTGSPAQIGQLMLDIRALEKQLPLADAPYKVQARAVLTEEQQKKLPTLSQALQLQTTAYQAINLLLIDQPVYPGTPIRAVFSGVNVPSCVGVNSTVPAVLPGPAR